jgi:hydroxymethylpyrimidine/phosphomethylpyrimidine kinase
MASSHPPARVLAIAGSDSGGGAGIQADLKALAACGVHGMTAITAITAQSTIGVHSVHPVPPDTVLDQVRAVAEDIGVDAVKIGMLGDVATIEAVETALGLVGDVPVVLDPVMVAESGATLLDEGAREALATRLVPRASVVTPNLAEAEVLAGLAGGRDERVGDPEVLARAIMGLGAGSVVITGGHLADGVDLFHDGTQTVRLPGERHPDGAAHGSGCTHSSALAAHLARGASALEAARAARALASNAVRAGLRGIGAGAGPVDALGLRCRTVGDPLT